MKKLMGSLFTVIISLIFICSLIGCNKDATSRRHETTVIQATTTSYLYAREEEQADNGAQIISCKQVNNIMFLEYYIGQIKNCFIQNIMTPIYNDGSIKKLSYTENSVTAKTISEGVAKSISTTNSVSLANSETNTLSWKLGTSSSTTASASVGVNAGIVSAEAGISETYAVSAEVGGATETTNSETVSKSTTDSVNNTYDISYLEEQCRSITTEFDMSDYEKGYYYALGLVADINVYQIVAYNIQTKDFYTTYFISNIDNTNTGIKMLSSSSVAFQIPSEKQLSPITEISVEEIKAVDIISKGNVTDFMGGVGTEDNPYFIGTAKHFMNIKLYPDAYYKLIADIDMTKISYLSINQFSGYLDGALHSISNLNYVDDTSSAEVCVGLFKKNFGTIQNLILRDCYFSASPKFKNNDINVYCGSVAAINSGLIRNCTVKDSTVVANSSNIAEIFYEKYNEDPRDLIRGAKNWKAWISQSFSLSTSNWTDDLLFKVYSGGISGINSGIIENCTFAGNVEANLYNMLVQSNTKEQTCLAGGIVAQNSGSVKSSNTTANVFAWIELNNDARGMGWVGDTYPKGVCFACGLVGRNIADSLISGQSNGEQNVESRIYVPQYAFLQGADYGSYSKGHASNLTINSNRLYCS